MQAAAPAAAPAPAHKRRVGSCDACYLKKKRCIPYTDTPDGRAATQSPCRACRHLQLPCTYQRLADRKTRTLRYALNRQNSEPEARSPSASTSTQNPPPLTGLCHSSAPSDTSGSGSSTNAATVTESSSSATWQQPDSTRPRVDGAMEEQARSSFASIFAAGQNTAISYNSHGTSTPIPQRPHPQQFDFAATAATAYTTRQASASQATGDEDQLYSEATPIFALAPEQPAAPLAQLLLAGPPRQSHDHHQQQHPPELLPTSRNYFALPPTPYLQPITILAPSHVLQSLIEAFFLYLHGINPIVHEPTFREKYRNQEHTHSASFFALVCAIVALTLVQVPRADLTATDPSIATADQVSQVATWADSLCREIAMRDGMKQASLDWLSAKYINALYHLQTGNWTIMNCLLGEAYALCSDYKLDKPSTYANLQRIEVQIARRLTWVLFTSDKMNSLFGNCFSRFHLSFGTIEMPQEVSDQSLSNTEGQSPNPTTSYAMSAFCLGASISRVLDGLLPIIREDMLESLPANRLMGRLAELEELQDTLLNLLRSAPKRLRLPHGAACDELMGIQLGQETPAGEAHIMSDDEFQQMLNTLLQNDLSDVGTFGRFTWLPDNTEIIAISNLHVSFLVSYMEICRHRRHLLLQLRLPISPVDDQMVTVSRALLDILMSVPISAVATNGRSLIRKVQHVVSTLNELILAPQAQRMVGEYLNMLAHLTFVLFQTLSKKRKWLILHDHCSSEYRFNFQQDRP